MSDKIYTVCFKDDGYYGDAVIIASNEKEVYELISKIIYKINSFEDCIFEEFEFKKGVIDFNVSERIK